MWKAAGIKVIPVVAAAVLAKHLEPLGIDAVIAEGTESGGHVGEMTTMALVPQVVDAVQRAGHRGGRHCRWPSAGGSAGAGRLRRAGGHLPAGKRGVPHPRKLQGRAAQSQGQRHHRYRTHGGAPVRVLKNRMSREYVRQEKAGADKMELEKYTLGSLRRAVFDGDTENGSLMAGQVAGMLHEVRPVEEIFAAMVSEAKTCITGLYKETI